MPRAVLESLRWHHEAGSVNVRTSDFLLLEGIAIDGLMKYCSVMLIKPKSKRSRRQEIQEADKKEPIPSPFPSLPIFPLSPMGSV